MAEPGDTTESTDATGSAGAIDIEAIIAENSAGRAELLAAIDAIPGAAREEPGVVDDWSVKDLLVHIAAWQEGTASMMEMMARGERPVLEGFDGDTDAYNAAVVEAAAGATWEHVMQRLRDARERHQAAARAMAAALPPERMAPGRTAERLAGGDGARHDREHAAQIIEWRRARAP